MDGLKDILFRDLKSMGVIFKPIPSSRRYWLIRNYSGKFYDDFKKHSFIGLGWPWEKDFCDEHRTSPGDPKYNKYLKENGRGRNIGKINCFMEEMSPGDVIITPAHKSSFLNMGIIQTDSLIVDNKVLPFSRVRRVRWEKEISWLNIPRKISRFLLTQHSVCSADCYAEEIDKLMYDMYTKGKQSYLTLNIKTTQKISANEIAELIQILDQAGKITGSEAILRIKTEINSPGILQVFGIGENVFLIALVLFLTVGGRFQIGNPTGVNLLIETRGVLPQILEFLQGKKERITSLAKSLEIDTRAFANDIIKLPEEAPEPEESQDENCGEE